MMSLQIKFSVTSPFMLSMAFCSQKKTLPGGFQDRVSMKEKIYQNNFAPSANKWTILPGGCPLSL